MELVLAQNKIFEIRGHRVMLDFHLAELYEVDTANLKRTVRRNMDSFPPEFMFELTKTEYGSLRYQIGILKRGQHSKYPPFAFTEHGIAMLSSVLKSKKARQVNIGIIKVFIALKDYAMNYNELQKKIEEIELKHNKNFEEIYKVLKHLLSEPKPKPREAIGYKIPKNRK